MTKAAFLLSVLLFAAAPMTAVAPRLDRSLGALAGTGTMQSPALEVAVVRDGKLAYDRGFGAATVQTRFPIASVTKLLTAVAVMQLVEQHRIDLDAKVATYLPSAPYASQITVRQLLNHTSGLWNYGDAAFNSGWVSKPTTPAKILSIVAAHPLDFAPGTKWAYSNSGYVVLGLLVERVSGQTLAAYEQQHIFAVAGMHDTTFGSAPVGTMAVGHMTPNGPPSPPYDPSWVFACGDAVSTAADLARFDIALMDGKLLSPATFARMQRHPIPTTIGGSQGLGVMMNAALGMNFVGHHGGIPGFAAEDEMAPKKGLAIVVLSDSFDFITGRANRIVLQTLFPQPAAVASAQDLRVEAQFRSVLESLLAGKIDPSLYTPQAAAALTPALLAATAQQLKPLGTVQTTTFQNEREIAGGTAYYFNVRFSGGQTMLWEFVLTPNGKIAGIGSAG